MAGVQPLDDIDVVELGTALAGPFATKLLADYGARVVTVEQPDAERDLLSSNGEAPDYTFETYNTGKEAVTLDLKSKAGQEVFLELISDADVFLENLRNGVVERLGFDWDEIRDRNPELIYCSVSGFGDSGPYADRPAFNGVVTGMSGWLSGEDDPSGAPIAAADHITGYCAWGGILMALINRGTTGTGEKVEVSMLDAMMACAGEEFAGYSAVQAGYDIEDPYKTPIQPGGYYEVADGHITLVVPQTLWEPFAEAIDKPEWANPDHRFAEKEYRLNNPTELREALEAVLRERTAADWLSCFDTEVPALPCGPVYWMDDVVEDPHVVTQDQVLSVDHSEKGEHFVPRPPVRLSDDSVNTDSIDPAPGVGEHTESILQSLGYSDAQIQSLRDEDVI